MYSPTETPSKLPSIAFREALLDANMLIWATAPDPTAALFNAPVYDVRLGGDDGMTGSDAVIKVPLHNPSIIITIGRPYGTEMGYAGETYKDCDLWVPFSVWCNSGATLDGIEQRLDFARDHRQNVFASHGIDLILMGLVGGKPRSPSPITGLDVMDYRWRARYSRE